MVVAIIALIAGVVVSRVDSIMLWKQRGDLRTFMNTWQFLFNESLATGESYRLVIDLDNRTYYVRREVPVTETNIVQVDLLKNLRTKKEKERRARQEAENIGNLDDEFRAEDDRQNQRLELLFYEFAYADPEGNVRLSIPLEFPSLAEPKELSDGVSFRDVKIHGDRRFSGQVSIRFSPRGASDFAVVRFNVGNSIFTGIMNPSTGESVLIDRDVDFEWSYGNA